MWRITQFMFIISRQGSLSNIPAGAGSNRKLVYGSELGWTSDSAVHVSDVNAVKRHALRVGEDALTPQEASRISIGVPGNYNVYVRYRFEGSAPGNANLRIVQGGTTNLTLTAVTPALTYDGGVTFNGDSGYYDVGSITLTDAAMTMTVQGPASAGDFVIVDHVVFAPVVLPGIGSMVIETDFTVT